MESKKVTEALSEQLSKYKKPLNEEKMDEDGRMFEHLSESGMQHLGGVLSEVRHLVKGTLERLNLLKL